MVKSIPLFYSDIPVGFVTVTQQGSRFDFSAECRESEKCILRAYACSRNNPAIRLLIGVMIPEGGVLSARRTYTRNDLQRLNIIPEQLDAGELVSESCQRDDENNGDWVKCSFPQRLFSDAALKSSLSGANDVLVDKSEKPTRVAARLGGGRFYLAPAFCLVRVTEINGVLYGVLGIDGDGMPSGI